VECGRHGVGCSLGEGDGFERRGSWQRCECGVDGLECEADWGDEGGGGVMGGKEGDESDGKLCSSCVHASRFPNLESLHSRARFSIRRRPECRNATDSGSWFRSMYIVHTTDLVNSASAESPLHL
jgi:hypothetical protein